jgi:hypothetical protein
MRLDEAILDPVADIIEADTTPIPLPPESKILAFHWQHPDFDPPQEACASLPKIVGPGKETGAA